MKKIFSTRLRALRKTNSYTQKLMSEKLLVSLSLYRCFERTTCNNMPSYQTLIELSNILGVSLDYLLGLSDNVTRV
jgi:transcriptional regulator with XRE-family HTH domain